MRVLVVAPHPDDEALACAGLVMATSEAHVVYVTSGDGFRRCADFLLGGHDAARMLALGRIRMDEAAECCRALGVRSWSFLGFPDGFIGAVLRTPVGCTARSPHTGADRVPYAGTLQPDAPYSAQALTALLRLAVARAAPDLLAVPVETDHHPDHRAVAVALAGVAPGVRRWTYLVHHDTYPGYGLRWNRALRPPAAALPGERRYLPLGPGGQERKLAAIALHGSQVAVLGRWMEAFVGREEPFGEAGT